MILRYKKDELHFYTISKECKLPDIKVIAPKFWKNLESNNDYIELFTDTTFGIIEYDNFFPSPQTAKYHIASQKCFFNSTKFTIPKSTWTIFNVKEIFIFINVNLFVNIKNNYYVLC